jgi:hypothetical protein
MAAQSLNKSRTFTLRILGLLHILLLTSLLFGLVTAKLPKPKPNNRMPPKPLLTHGVVTRQMHPNFNCSAVTGNSDCKGAIDCLYADPDRCGLFIHCDKEWRCLGWILSYGKHGLE